MGTQIKSNLQSDNEGFIFNLVIRALNPNLNECSNLIPSWVMMMILAPAPMALEAPSTNTLHERFSTWQTIFVLFFGENSATKSARTWPFTAFRSLYCMSKEPSCVPHLAILSVKSDLFNNNCNGYSVKTNTVWA